MRAAALRLARCGLIAAAVVGGLLGSAPESPAAEVGRFPVEGLRLGDSMSAAQARFPFLHLESVPYLDPQIGDRYQVLYGRLAVERYEGNADTKENDHLLTVLAHFTGDQALYALRVRREGAEVDCARQHAATVERYGKPDDDEQAPTYAYWAERDFYIDLKLEFECLPGEAYQFALTDNRQPDAYREQLAKELEPYVREVLTTVQ